MMRGAASSVVSTGSSPACRSRCSYSPITWWRNTFTSVASQLTATLPVAALAASTRSSVSRRSRCDWRSSTSMYSRAAAFSTFSFFSRST